ncbi:hypothetical protein NCS57_01174800 [Fusarium keratoplasticum]|uniref:Uncharacterized protein n=1 Tax=Fusarium keratoplasticum TaxID=1328300 RepID=A0ACC0QLG0_9HYPO|nr:hypothetical protein NCS57_01174800 [Fusarium keratoplasticum]KAI8657947.1 hypothetical protein NCS57_01174800 [Fusarium keratoplasticum]
MPQTGRFTRPVACPRAFGNAILAIRRAQRRALVDSIVAMVRQILPAQGANAYNHTEETTTEPLHQTDEDILDEYLRGHERGFLLGLSRGHDRGYRQGVASGYAYSLSHGQQVAYDAGFKAGIAYNRKYQ